MKLIDQNPFRVLGIPINANAKDLAGNFSKKRLLDIGKDVAFPIDQIPLSSPVVRTADGMSKAYTAINLPKDKVRFALFWFAQPQDTQGKLAYDHLLHGSLEQALATFEQSTSWESKLCLSVLHLQAGRYADALAAISVVIENHSDDFLSAVGDKSYVLTAEELRRQYIEEFASQVSPANLIKVATSGMVSRSMSDHLRDIAVEKPIAAIEKLVDTAEAADQENAQAQLKAGKDLMRDTQEPLAELRQLAGADDSRYGRLADKVAQGILQCSINYHNTIDNASDDPVAASVIDECLALAEHAQSICVGMMTKQRIEENLNILRDKKNNLPPAGVEAEAAEINSAIREFEKLDDKLDHCVMFLNTTQPHLQKIKDMGTLNHYYLRLSTVVVETVLSNLISEINTVLSDGTFYQKKFAIRKACTAMKMMDKFDMEEDYRQERFIPNQDTLSSLQSRVKRAEEPETSHSTVGCIIGAILIILVVFIRFWLRS